jgi:hypothetical protein
MVGIKPLIIFSMSLWNTEGALVKPNGITLNSNNPLTLLLFNFTHYLMVTIQLVTPFPPA